jgi:pimeloyl-ACP methyl ester carboxylesterase
MKHARLLAPFSAVAAAALLAACGGSDGPAGGSLIDTPTILATLTAAQIDASTASSGLQAISGTATCDVKVVALNYNTPDTRGDNSNASGVMLVPTGTGCTGPSPLLAYARGTEVLKTRTLANPADPETFSLLAIFAAKGYTVVATDYLGYGKSTATYHPYLHADSEASSVIDSIRAARAAASTVGANLSGKVMLSGYSQGGHASMAAHRAIERDFAGEFNLVAGAHLAGPYNLSGSFKLADLNNPIAGYQFFIPLIITSWQKTYGGLYSDVDKVFKAPYAATIENLLPNPTLTYTTLLTSGALPAGTPKQAQDALMQSDYLTDIKTNDNNALYLAAKKNDLLSWAPKAQTMLCGGAGDPTVPPVLHQTVAKAAFDAQKLLNVSSVDVDGLIQATYGVTSGSTKVAPTDPTSAAFATYYGNYHGGYEPPFCYAAARTLFDAVK